jgi:hypothetical protein
MVSGRVEGRTLSDANGRFTFTNIEGGAYVVEYVDHKERVIAAGHTFRIARGETVATFVRLTASRRWAAGMFSSVAAAVVSSAAGLGVTAVAPTGRPASRDR